MPCLVIIVIVIIIGCFSDGGCSCSDSDSKSYNREEIEEVFDPNTIEDWTSENKEDYPVPYANYAIRQVDKLIERVEANREEVLQQKKSIESKHLDTTNQFVESKSKTSRLGSIYSAATKQANQRGVVNWQTTVGGKRYTKTSVELELNRLQVVLKGLEPEIKRLRIRMTVIDKELAKQERQLIDLNAKRTSLEQIKWQENSAQVIDSVDDTLLELSGLLATEKGNPTEHTIQTVEETIEEESIIGDFKEDELDYSFEDFDYESFE